MAIEGPQQQEFIELEDDAFFALTTDKDEVFEGEGFTTTLAFYISDQNQAPINFHDPGRQLVEILKKIRPSNCWEENFNIQNIESERVEIKVRDIPNIVSTKRHIFLSMTKTSPLNQFLWR